MRNILLVLELLVTVFLIGSIVLQAKGTGLDSTFGGGGEFYRSRRGVEKFVVYLTVFLGLSFALLSVALLLIS